MRRAATRATGSGALRTLVRRARYAGRRFGFELCLLALFLATGAALVWREDILRQTIEITPESIEPGSVWVFNDSMEGGISEVTFDPRRPMSWTCNIQKRYTFPFCGYELRLDRNISPGGLDLSHFQSLTVDLTYHGPSDKLRIHMKNYDPGYTGADEAARRNRVEFAVRPGRQTVQLHFDDFSVAEWWLLKYNIPPNNSRPLFNRVVSFDMETATNAAAGMHQVNIHRVTLEGQRIPADKWYLGIILVWSGVIGVFLAYRFAHLKKELEAEQKLQALAARQAREAELAARRDHLTQLLNRAGVLEAFQAMKNDPCGCRSVSVILLDIDHFKRLNDTYGHNYGDEVLSSIAQLLRRNVRNSDIVGRWGGEEFIIICKDVDEAGAVEVADKLRARIEHFHFGECEKVSASFGVYWHGDRSAQLIDMVRCADAALYVAKRRGRNRAVPYTPLMLASTIDQGGSDQAIA